MSGKAASSYLVEIVPEFFIVIAKYVSDLVIVENDIFDKEVGYSVDMEEEYPCQGNQRQHEIDYQILVGQDDCPADQAKDEKTHHPQNGREFRVNASQIEQQLFIVPGNHIPESPRRVAISCARHSAGAADN